MDKNKLKKLKKNFPKTIGVMGRDRLLNSAVLIPLVKIKGEYYILFQKRAAHIRQGGDICFPGGKYEAHEDKNFKQTAIRETYEELGIEKKDIEIIGRLDTMIAPIGAIIEPFVGIVSKKAVKNMKIDKNEVEKTLLVPVSFFKNNPPKEYTLRAEVKPYHIDEDGNKEVYFPTKELNLPKQYHTPWGHRKHKVWLYQYEGENIWGVTSVIINDFLKKF